MSKLYVLHGWAQSRQIWFQQQAAFPDAQFLNLPGHGGAADQPPERWQETLIDQLPDQPVTLVGWSLGGILALAMAAAQPERIARLILIGATPCFCRRAGWPHGCDAELFAAFEAAVASGSPKSLNRFFALMLHGDRLPRADYNRLAKLAVDRAHPVTPAGLQAGLELLASLDLRAAVPQLTMPLLLLHGAQDAIIDVASSRWLAEQWGGAVTLQLWQDCGHAPFLTQPDRFRHLIEPWTPS